MLTFVEHPIGAQSGGMLARRETEETRSRRAREADKSRGPHAKKPTEAYK
jgi:hypothetical protein